jgi:hypothetical protein
MKKLVLDGAKSLGLYLLVVVGGTVAFLSVAPVVGYLPYSDRPGPGWFGSFPAVNWLEFVENFRFMLGWAMLLAPYAVVAGLIIFSLARALEFVRTPRLIVALVCAVISACFSGYLVLAFGWYIAIDTLPVYFAMLMGLLFGGLLLPKRRVVADSGA